MRRTWLFLFALASIAAHTEAQTADVDLLRTVPTQVVVSSAISPGLSGPSRMLDGRDNTAWCSRTGDLLGAWVLVAIPSDARVSEIRLTPGYVINEHDVPSWDRNHRITRVAISRDGVSLGEHDLDPSVAALQSMPVSGPGGLYRIEVRATVAGTVRSYGEACITSLEVRGQPGSARSTDGPEARVATLRGSGTSALLQAHGAARTTRFAEIDTYDRASIGDVSDAEAAYVPLVQSTFVSRVRIHRVVARGPARGDHVLYVYYYVSPYEEARMTARLARRARGSFRDEGCEDEEGADDCPTLRVARISVPASGVPVVDGDIELGADVCSDTLTTLVRDLDADHVDELRVSLAWQTHPVCPVGFSDASFETIVDEQTLRAEYEGVPDHRDAGTCGRARTERRRVVDLNADGHPDFEVHVSDRFTCDGFDDEETRRMSSESGEAPPVVTTERYLYDVVSDAWHLAPP